MVSNPDPDKAMALGVVGVLVMVGKLSPTSLTFAHLFGVCGQLGIQFWVGLIDGPTKRKYMDWRAFAQVQAIIFPKYAVVSCSLAILAMATFWVRNRGQSLNLDGSLLVMATIMGLLNGLALIPATNASQKHWLDADDSDKEMKDALRGEFLRIHAASMTFFLACMALNAAYLYIWAGQVAHSWV